jgi:hypothetical protein
VAYRLWFDSEVLHFILSLDDDERGQILHWFRRLKESPFTRGRFIALDSVGRDVEVSVVSNYLVYHWTDHAVKTINVIGMENA